MFIAFKVKDPEYFFFPTQDVQDPGPVLSCRTLPAARPQVPECQQCKEEVTHYCPEDQEALDQEDQESPEVATPEEWRELLEDHIRRIEDDISQTNHNDQDKNKEKINEEMTSLTCDWTDVSDAIDSIPGQAAPGPDGIPAILLKRAKKPMSRMICKLLTKTLHAGEIPKRLKRSLIIPI